MKARFAYKYYSNRVTEIITQPMFANMMIAWLSASLRSKANIISYGLFSLNIKLGYTMQRRQLIKAMGLSLGAISTSAAVSGCQTLAKQPKLLKLGIFLISSLVVAMAVRYRRYG